MARAAAHRRELCNLLKYVKSYTVILLMPYLYEDGIGQAWQTLIDELEPMGYSVQDEEKLELHASLASDVRLLLHLKMLLPLKVQSKTVFYLSTIFSLLCTVLAGLFFLSTVISI